MYIYKSAHTHAWTSTSLNPSWCTHCQILLKTRYLSTHKACALIWFYHKWPLGLHNKFFWMNMKTGQHFCSKNKFIFTFPLVNGIKLVKLMFSLTCHSLGYQLRHVSWIWPVYFQAVFQYAWLIGLLIGLQHIFYASHHRQSVLIMANSGQETLDHGACSKQYTTFRAFVFPDPAQTR
jgi:hypothetical protein